jgi:hypothetical protein
MNTPEDLEARLAKADPAYKSTAPTLSPELISQATKANKQIGIADRFQLLSAKARSLTLGGLASGVTGVAAIALVVTMTPQPLIQLSASPLSSQTALGMSAESSDKMMSMPFQTYQYVAGPGLSNESGSGQVYKLVRQGTPESVLANLAKVFDISGSVKKFPDYSPENPGFYYGKTDDPWGAETQEPMVSIWWSGTGTWNYSNSLASSSISSDCVNLDVDGNCQEWVEPVATPELLPARADAIATALEIFTSTGLSVTESDLRVDYSDWGVNISAALKVDGKPTSIEWYVGWSSTGELSYASGHSVSVQAVGSYRTVSPVESVSRLSDWRWFGSAAYSLYEKYQPAVSDMSVRSEPYAEPATEPEEAETEQPVEPEPGVSASPTPVDPAPTETPEPAPIEPAPIEPEVITLTVVSAEAALLSIWDSAGDVWLVPGFILVNDQGWWSSIISLIEGVIALPEPSTMDIMPLPADDSSVSNK